MNHRKLTCSFFSCLIFFLVCMSTYAQPKGKLIIQNFDLQEIGSNDGSFWSVVQDNRGIIYIGGEEAVFEFDGTSWRCIYLPNKSVVRSLAIDDKGIVYVGGVSEFGYLRPDSIGITHYVSLLDRLPVEQLDFPDIWSTNTIGGTVFFQSATRLFIYENDEIRSIELQNSYHRSFAVEGQLLLNQEGIGLCILQDDELQLMEGGEFFSKMLISSLSIFDGGKLLIGTRRSGLWVYDPSGIGTNKVLPHSSEASEFLKEYHLYHGISLPGSKYAFSTLRNGTVIMNKKGDILEYINKSNGSSDHSAYFLMLTNDSELWITSGSGVSLYNINSAMSYWDEQIGLKGTVNAILEYENSVFISTYSGLFMLDIEGERNMIEAFNPTTIKQYQEIDSEVWSMLVFNPKGIDGNRDEDQLLALTGQGLYNVDKDHLEFKTDRTGVNTMFHSKIDPTILYLNAHPTFYILQYRNGEWNTIWEKQVSSYVNSIVEDPEGNIWLGTDYYGVYSIVPNDVPSLPVAGEGIRPAEYHKLRIKNYGLNHGLPDHTMAKLHLFNDRLIVTGSGIMTFDSNNKRFIRAENFGKDIMQWDAQMNDFQEDAFGNIWGANNEILDRQPDGHYQVVSLPYKALTINSSTLCYYHDDRGATWIGGGNTLLKYDNKQVLAYQKNDFKSLIRTVKVGRDSLIFGGAHIDLNSNEQGTLCSQPEMAIPTIMYKMKSISFEYSCPYFRDDIPLKYSYMLEGYDDDWSEWSSTTSKDYNNLREKSYVFHVRAMNYAGDISSEAAYYFIIAPPWQRTLVFYIVLAISILTFSYFSVKAYVKRLKESNINLENLVRERTSELELQKEEIHQQANKLKSQNEKLTSQRNRMSEMSKEILKTNRDKLRFFTNISHELRTPLTLILGPIEELENENKSYTREQVKSKYDIIHRNANRLLGLVNQILDFRKLELARPKLTASEGDIVAFSSELTGCFTELAANSNINLVFQSAEKEIITWFDSDKVGKMLVNLISNAFKYSNEGDEVIVSLEHTRDFEAIKPNTSVIKLRVSDSGIGIEAEKLPKIFDRFYHSGRSLTLEQAGSGIGLSMVASLAEIHQGRIEVQSEPGVGSEFTLIIPFGESYLKPEEKWVEADRDIIRNVSARAKKEVTKQMNVALRKKITQVDKDSDKKLVLLVEDSEDIRSYVISGLDKKYDFIEAENGVEGLELAAKHHPDLLISDIRMPEMNGYELCNHVKSNLDISHIPVILLTSKSADADIKQGLEAGADSYITKPFSLDLLEARIDNLVQSAERMKQRFSKDLVFKPADIVITSTDEKFLSKAFKVVEANLSSPAFDIDIFSKEMAMSQSTLYRKLKALTGVSTNNFIKEFRLKQAAHIMLKHELPVSEVSLMVGFDDPAYFAKSFKSKFNMTPTEYVKENK